ncbi:glycoside hydrolase family 25 protein [Myroides phaeus]|uniref:Lysozyme n=1 Tax=Myroides phaeus TaxID=702745 RepID=A0A1G8BCB5_9FLAO|nr:glycoside hydrolase family 25 protein [Myroides phaeus]MEC4117008.1 glycoside hydrolase family 25 protein [Myroides phaeus]SDH30902.1 lysozyme [Myroides phaeus]
MERTSTKRNTSNPRETLKGLNKQPRKKTTRNTKKKTKSSSSSWTGIKWIIIINVLLGGGIWLGIHFQDGFKYFFSQDRKNAPEKSLFDFRTAEVLARHDSKMIGFDVSHYQGVIDWGRVDSVASKSALEFVFVRATMGVDGVDRAYKLNWKGAGANHFIRGAYHYYRPDENSVEQANNFIKTVKLAPGDLPPVLDIEDLPKKQSVENLRLGLKRWIELVEEHYKVKPILYSGEHYYTNHLKQWFPDHILWIANYNFFVEEIKPEWHFWQFTEKGIVNGIEGKVDLNIYNGNKTEMRKLLLK